MPGARCWPLIATYPSPLAGGQLSMAIRRQNPGTPRLGGPRTDFQARSSYPDRVVPHGMRRPYSGQLRDSPRSDGQLSICM